MEFKFRKTFIVNNSFNGKITCKQLDTTAGDAVNY